MANTKFVFDFDSTLTSVEGLDMLAEIALEGNPEKDKIVKEISAITDLGVDGEISFTDSLSRRVALLKAGRSELNQLIEVLKTKVSPSVSKNLGFFKTHKNDIYVISAGFKEFIIPVVAELGIDADRVYANTFKFDEQDQICGFDNKNHLSKHNGKVDCLKEMNLDGEVQIIGDGYSDFVMVREGVAQKFFAYTENVNRKKATDNADYVVNSFDEFLAINKL